MIRLRVGRAPARLLHVLLACAVLVAACGGDGRPSPRLLVGNTLSGNVAVIDVREARYTSDLLAPGAGGLTSPDDLTWGPDGHLYVSSGTTTSGQILRYDGTTGAFLGVFAEGGGMRRPYGTAFGPDGHLYVASFRSDQILVFDGRTGAFRSVFASGDGTAAGMLNGPNDLAFGSDGLLYVTTQGSVADASGDVRFVHDSQVLRYDPVNGRGEVFAPMPAPTPGGAGYVSFLGLAWGPDGRLWTSDYAGGIRAYDRLGGEPALTIDTGRLLGGSVPVTVGNLVFSDGTLYLPVFQAEGSVPVANGVAACDPVAAACRLLMRDDTRLSRPIGIAVAR